MKKTIFFTALFGLLISTNLVYAKTPIIDISKNVYKEAIYEAVKNGYMNLDKNGAFHPKESVTKEQLASILSNFEDHLEKKQLNESNNIKEENAELTMVSNVMKSVVKITSSLGKGSGVFIDQNTIITANHVVKTNDEIKVWLSDRQGFILASVESRDEWQDLALLKIDDTLKNENYKVSTVPIAKQNVQLGETVYAFGNPGNLDFSVSKGIISNTSQPVAYKTMYQIDVNIQPGNSGGPLINSNGELIGVVNGKYLDNPDNTGIKPQEGISFAAKLDVIQEFIR